MNYNNNNNNNDDDNNYKQLLDEVFVISGIINVEESVNSRAKGGNFIYPMMHRFIPYYQASERT